MSEKEEFKNGNTLSFFFYWLSWRLTLPIFGANIFQKFGLVDISGAPNINFRKISVRKTI